MTLQQQVCTLQQAKRLKELGIEQASLFWWNQNTYKVAGDVTDGHWTCIFRRMSDSTLAAFTVAELGQMLPSESGMICWDVSYNDHHGVWECRIYDLVKWLAQEDIRSDMPPVAYESEEDTMADAMADTLIHCLENNLITASDCNNRLVS